MTITALSVVASTYKVGLQQRFYNVRGSTPATGAINEGVGEWHVYRGGLRIEAASRYGILDFGWLGQDGDVVRGRFVDKASSEGEFVADTFSGFGSSVLEVYVDPTGGNNANPGTLASPIATRAEARSRVLAALTTAGQTATVYLKRGEIHAYAGSGGEWWAGDDVAFAHQVRFVAYGIGARPIVRVTSSIPTSVAFRTGKRASIHLIGLEIDCVEEIQDGTGNTTAINCQRFGAGTRAPIDLLVDDCVIHNATTFIGIEDDTITSDAVLATGVCDFVALRDVDAYDIGAYHMFESTGLRYVHRERVQFRRQLPLLPTVRNTDRCSNWLHSYMAEMTWDTRGTDGVNGSVRFQSGGSTSSSPTVWRYGSYIDCTYYGNDTLLAKVGHGRKAPDDTVISELADVRWVNLKAYSAQVAVGGGTGSGAGCYIDRLQYWNCIASSWELDITGPATGPVGQFRSIEIRDCATSQTGSTPLPHVRLQSDTEAKYAAGSVTVTGHVGLHPSTAGNQALYYSAKLTQAQLISKINVASNYNHVARHGDGFTPVYAYGGFLVSPTPVTFDLTLPAWQAARGDAGDANSTATINSTIGIVNVGTAAADMTDFDPHYSSGAGPLDGLGGSDTYSIDGDGFIRPAPNDPGPYHFGATAVPSLPLVASEIEPIASWLTVGFVRLTAGTLDVSVKAAALSAAEMADGIASVAFAVAIDGTLAGTVTVTTPSLRYPNFTDEPSRMPGVLAGTLAPFYGYGFEFDTASYAAGKITVVATVTTGNGADSVLPTLTFYNHKSGSGLTLPSTKVVYLDFDAGNDANSGVDWANAVLTAKRAQDLARVTPGGGDLGDKDAGGARIICRGTAEGGSASGAVDIHTSEGWLTFEADAAGCRWGRSASPAYTAATDAVYAGAGTGTSCRIRFKGINFVGAGPVVVVGTGCTATAWHDGGTHYSYNWQGPGVWSVRYSDDEGPALSFDGGTGARRYATGVDRGGCVHGFAGYSFVYDCDIHEFLGIAVQFVGTETPSTACAIRLRNQRYTPGTVKGYLRMDGNTGAGGTASPSLVASVTLPGILRITGPVGGYDFGTPASDLLGSAIWGVKVTGLTAPNNGTWPYLRNGVSGGAHWIEMQCPTATATSVGAGAASLVTAKLADGTTYYDAIHPDGLQVYGARDGDVVFDWVMESTPSMQSFFTSGDDQTRLLIENVRDDGSGLVLNISNSTLTGCIFRNITNSGPLTSSDSTMLACEVTNCVFAEWSGVASIAGLESRIDSNHFITGFATGTASTSGVWFAGSPTTPPAYSMEPRSIRIGTGTELGTEPDAWAWDAALPTRGVMRNVALDNWNLADRVGGLSVSFSASMAGAGQLRIVGAVAASVAASVQMLSTLGSSSVVGELNATVEAQMNGVGVLRVTGTISTVVAATITAVGRLGPEPILGALSASVSATVTMTGSTDTISAEGLRERIRRMLGLRTRTKRRPFWQRPWR